MINSFTVTNHLGESLELVLADPDSSGLAILSVDGLGQAEADVTKTKLADSNFSVINSAYLKPRNIVFKIMYWGDDIEKSRHVCDKYFPAQERITLGIHTDYRNLVCSGVVEFNKPDIFSPKSSCQISIVCDDPYLYEENETVNAFGGLEAEFEFPFPNSDELTLTVNDETIDCFEFGTIDIDRLTNVYYNGEADVGFVISISCHGDVRGLSIYDHEDNTSFTIDDDVVKRLTGGDVYGKSFSDGDTITISSNKKGDKYIKLLRHGTTYNIINAVNKPINWFTLHRGDNLFSYYATLGAYDMDLSIKYRTAYKGI